MDEALWKKYSGDTFRLRHHKEAPQPIPAKKGDRLLLVCALNGETLKPGKDAIIDVITREGPFEQRRKQKQYYDNIVINHHGQDASFRVLLIPFKAGEPLPTIAYDAKNDSATVTWADQTDTLRFTKAKDRVKFTLKRK